MSLGPAGHKVAPLFPLDSIGRLNYKPFAFTGLAGTMDHVLRTRSEAPGQAGACRIRFRHGIPHLSCTSGLRRLPRQRISIGLLACMFLLAGCVASLHHHHDLQSSTPCPVCYAIHFPARIGPGVHIPQLALLGVAPNLAVHIAWTEPSPKDCPPRAPPA